MYNTEVFKDSRRPAGTSCSRSMTLPDGKSNKGRVQAYDGPIYIADAALYLMNHKPELGIKDPYELTEDQYNAALDLLRAAAPDRRPLLARRLRADRRLHQRRRGRLVAPGRSRSTCCRRQEQPIASVDPEGRRHRLGRHHHDARRRAAPELRLHVAGALDSTRSCRATWPPGSARCRRCRRPARATSCSGPTGCETNGLENFDKIHFWRTPVANCATQDASACRTTAG